MTTKSKWKTKSKRTTRSDFFLPGWNYRSSRKMAKSLLANESNPLVRKILKDLLRMNPNKYVRN